MSQSHRAEFACGDSGDSQSVQKWHKIMIPTESIPLEEESALCSTKTDPRTLATCVPPPEEILGPLIAFPGCSKFPKGGPRRA